uniref:Uncharacterized protein n=1 Tax=Globisporangium ultimum (strain ATCC 200006 / CBS 805.95 / DAOM BR144) TaxID=431595 RepID=K3XC26_GLOUD
MGIWFLSRSIKWWVTLVMLVYIVVLLAFFGLDPNVNGSIVSRAAAAGGLGSRIISLTKQKAPMLVTAKPEDEFVPRPEEVAAINKLLGIQEGNVQTPPVAIAASTPQQPKGNPNAALQPGVRVPHHDGVVPNAVALRSNPVETNADAEDIDPTNTKDETANEGEVVAAVISAALAPFTSKDRSEWSVEDHSRELKRLQILRDTAQSEVARLQAILDAAKKMYAAQATELESIYAVRALDIRKHQPRRIRPNLSCLGWKQTAGCGPWGNREPEQDHACNQLVTGGVSGYCEMVDLDTDEHFRVMQLNCSSVRDHVSFSCTNAADFANFGLRSQEIYEKARDKPLASLQGAKGFGNGIVIVVYPKLMTSAYATIRTLRSYGCVLPIELWVLESEMARSPKKTEILRAVQEKYGPVSVKTIKDPTVTGFTTKIHAIYNSEFENVLFLDADNVPVKDPTYLFYSKEFQANSAIFWPDFWHPKNTIFNIQELSLLWELVDMPFVDMFEQESGQILINRRKSAVAMEVLQFYAFHRPNHFDRLILAHGDKDLFRLAWMKTNTDFYMVPYPPGAAGTIRENKFCGMTMVQYDATGEVLFLHRNAKKLNGRVTVMDEPYWTHLQSFDWRPDYWLHRRLQEAQVGSDPVASPMMSYQDIKTKYIIGIQSSAPLFREFQSCYGAERIAYPYFNLTEWNELPFRDIETQIINYAHEAALLTKASPKKHHN